MTRTLRILGIILLVGVVLQLTTLGSTDTPRSPRDPARPRALATEPGLKVYGMTVSAHRAGQSWGTDAMVPTMGRLKTLGVSWSAIHPYGGLRADGTVGSTRGPLPDDVPWLKRPIAEAHRLGLKIMIKPHLAYWHSPFSWRGAIEFETEEQWNRFFLTYAQWITRLAEICADADAFVVGTELDRTVRYEARWRAIIESIRARTGAPLTYAANWDAYQRVPFWDALDVIGVQAYFPLVQHEEVPEAEELAASWRRITAELEKFGRKHDRKILLSELGYDCSVVAAARPWESHRRGRREPGAEEIQRRCLEAALGAVEESEAVVGAFLWKWFPGESARGSHIMSTPVMQAVIREQWGAARATGEPAAIDPE